MKLLITFENKLKNIRNSDLNCVSLLCNKKGTEMNDVNNNKGKLNNFLTLEVRNFNLNFVSLLCNKKGG